MSNTPARIAISAGDPAGVGPDIALELAQRDWPCELVVVADRDLLAARAALLGLEVALRDVTDLRQASSRGELRVLHEPLARPVTAGAPDPANAPAVLAALRRVADGCTAGSFDAMVTGPVSKAVITDSGTPFSGHTEYLAEVTGAEHVVMLLAHGSLRVALATTHMPLAAVPRALTAGRLERTLRVLSSELRDKFAIREPRISVLGLNPHAGEEGKLGREEIDMIIPLLTRLREDGLHLFGPLPADTAFNPERRGVSDAYLAMYHDQGLPVLKFAGFGGAVNVTLGLPIIRTSVDHGTAFELAGTGRAQSGSMHAAVELALELVRRRG